jgi:RND family efflux transporter MFP subunit
VTSPQEQHPANAPPPQRSAAVVFAIALGTLAVIAVGALLYLRARSKVNDVSLSEAPKSVTVVRAQAGTYRAERHYVATLDPWVVADVGPQVVSAYTDTVLVRPGAEVKRGQIIATLDCRDANASNRAVSMQARAIEARQKAVANEASRIHSLLDGGFVAPNEAEQKLASSESQLAELAATEAKMVGTSLAVNDCVLRAPFDGEVARRLVDPGAFVKPGTAVASLVDRSTVRVIADVPEGDFAIVAPGTPVKIKMLATGGEVSGAISRRSPAASRSTRTVHFEIDLPDPERKIPVGTTADLTIQVGKEEPATVLPSLAASIRGEKATIFVAEGDRAKKLVVTVKGESLGTLFLDVALKPGTLVVTEGRSLLGEGDKIDAKEEPPPPPPPSPHASVGAP